MMPPQLLVAAVPPARAATPAAAGSDGSGFGAILLGVLEMPASKGEKAGEASTSPDGGNLATGEQPTPALGVVPALPVPASGQVPFAVPSTVPVGTSVPADAPPPADAAVAVKMPDTAVPFAVSGPGVSGPGAAVPLAVPGPAADVPFAVSGPGAAVPLAVSGPGTAVPFAALGPGAAVPIPAMDTAMSTPGQATETGPAVPPANNTRDSAGSSAGAAAPVNIPVVFPAAEAGAGETRSPAPGASGPAPPAPVLSAAVLPAPVPQVQGQGLQQALPPAAALGYTDPGRLTPQLAGPLFSLASAAPGEHVMTLKVSPEDLGPVTVRAHIDASGVRIELFAPGDAGRDALRTILPELRRGLAESGPGTSLDLSDQNSPPDSGGGPGQNPGSRYRGRPQPTVEAPPEPVRAARRPAVVIAESPQGRLDILA